VIIPRSSRILLGLAALPALGLARPSSPRPAPLVAQATEAQDTAPPAPFALSDPDGHDLVPERLDAEGEICTLGAAVRRSERSTTITPRLTPIGPALK
jgi:hypothetical protein